MADNVAVTAGTGTSIATDDIGGVHHQRMKLSLGADGSATDALGGAGSVAAGVQRMTLASDDPLVAAMTADVVTCTTSVTRPANTTAYAIGDAISNSTTAPTSGGFTFSNVVRAAGKGGILSDLIVTSSNFTTTGLQAEVIIFDSAVTNINDNAVYGISDSEVKTIVAIVPFVLFPDGNNSRCHVQNINAGFVTVGNANLRFLVRASNAYAPASAEEFTFRATFLPVG